MSEIKKNIEVELGSEKTFGYFFSFIFLIIAIYPYINGGDLRAWSLLISLLILVITFLKPRLLSKLNYLWAKLGILIGGIVSPIVLGIVYFFVVFPTGLLMKIFRKDILNINFDDKKSSYWILKEDLSFMRNQF
tara:strand:- start:981 stop:1382 length:402 start_codon:yes stop_codon:yes gene_type:complete